MKAEIKYIHSPDIEDLETYIPCIEDNFRFLLQVFVGIKGEKGEESFDIEIYTPKWLLSNCAKNEIILPKYSLIVFEYNFERIFQRIKQLIESCTGNTWEEIAQKAGLIGHWEFEDYQE